jgi:hypothetical protein
MEMPQGFTRFVSTFTPLPPGASATRLVSENAVAAATVRFAEPIPALYTPPVQLKLKVSVPAAVGVTVCVPVAARLPLHPPLAVQLEPFEDHVTTVD